MLAEIPHPLLVVRTPSDGGGAIACRRHRQRLADTTASDTTTPNGGRRLLVLGCLASVSTAVAAAGSPRPPSTIHPGRVGGFVGIGVGGASLGGAGDCSRRSSNRHESSAFHTSATSKTDWRGNCRGGIGVVRGISGTVLASVPSSSEYITTTASSNNEATKGLADALREAYSASSTDGVLALFPDLLLPDGCSGDDGSDDVPHPRLARYTAEELLEASVEAAGGSSVDVASIVNALLAGCCPGDGGVDEQVEAVKEETASGLFRLLLGRSPDSVKAMEPDLVTCACAFAACRRRAGDHGGHHPKDDVADLALRTARKRAKKLGGGRLRRSLARTRRRRGGSGNDGDEPVLAMDVAGDLRDRYGVEVLYEDDMVMGLSKPSGMVCRHRHNKSGKGASAGGGGDSAGDVSLEDVLDSLRLPLSTVNAADGGRGIVHRLDRGTSGCIVVAKTDEAHLLLVAEFFRRNVRKSYLALVPGCGVDPPSGVLDSDVDGRPARSMYRVEEVYGDGGPDNASSATLLRVETETGRRHQVRVHCAEGLGRPIFLDSTYGSPPAVGDGDGDVAIPPSIAAAATDDCGGGHSSNDEGDRRGRGGGRRNDRRRTRPRCDRLFLHASTLHVPSFGVDIRAPLPGWWEEAVAGL